MTDPTPKYKMVTLSNEQVEYLLEILEDNNEKYASYRRQGYAEYSDMIKQNCELIKALEEK